MANALAVLPYLPWAVASYNTGLAITHHIQSKSPAVFATMMKIKSIASINGWLAVAQGFVAAKVISDHYQITPLILHTLEMGNPGLLMLAPLAIAVYAITCFAVTNLVKKVYQPKEDIEALKKKAGIALDDKKISIKWGSSDYQHNTQFVQVAQLISSCALLALSANPVALTINSLALAYSLHKSSSWKFIQIEAKHKMPTPKSRSFHDGLLTITYKYFIPLFAAAKSKDECIACEGAKPEIYFCSKHVVHLSCVLKNIRESVLKGLGDTAAYQSTTHTKRENGTVTDQWRTYELWIKTETLPICPHPDCNVFPETNTVELTTKDRVGMRASKRRATVNFVENLPNTEEDKS